VSAGHRYRADGWCAHPECFRHIGDEADFGFCPDRHGYDVPGRGDLPPDKRQQHARLRKQQDADMRTALLAFAARWFR
jgi:hypothetical protein